MWRPIHLLDLISKEKLDRALQVFTGVTGVAAIIAHTDGTPITRPMNFTPFCSKYCRSTIEGKRHCQESDRHGGMISARLKTAHIYNCLNAGLIDSAAPVIVETYHLATILCGQVLEEPLDPETAKGHAQAIGVTDIDGYLSELARVPIMSKERLRSIVNLMAEITQTISELALQKYMLHKNSQHYLNRLINSVSDCIISTNADDSISMINEAGARMFGYETEELIGESILNLFHDGPSRKTYKKYVYSRTNENWRAELTAGRADGGDAFPVQVCMSRILDEKEKQVGHVGVIRDISEEKKIERMKEDLIGMLTHDLRNPVLSVQKAIQLLINGTLGPVSEKQLEVMRMILVTSHQMYGMASDLLDIYRKENGQFILHKSDMDLRQSIQESINQMSFMLQDKRITLALAAPQEPLILFGDQNRITRTCVNLLDNAIKYSPEESQVDIRCRQVNGSDGEDIQGSIPRRWLRRLRPARTYILTSIMDQGNGIPEKYQELIFDKFFTIKSHDPKQRKGVGLGLAFCKQVIETHNGLIWVNSPTSVKGSTGWKGCRFSFILPAGQDK